MLLWIRDPESGVPMPFFTGKGSHGYDYKFHPKRRWLFDMAWPELKLALEVEGGTRGVRGGKRCQCCGHAPQGRHSRAQGFENDCIKYGEAQALGWVVLRVTVGMIDSGKAIDLLKRVVLVRASLAESAKL